VSYLLGRSVTELTLTFSSLSSLERQRILNEDFLQFLSQLISCEIEHGENWVKLAKHVNELMQIEVEVSKNRKDASEASQQHHTLAVTNYFARWRFARRRSSASTSRSSRRSAWSTSPNSRVRSGASR